MRNHDDDQLNLFLSLRRKKYKIFQNEETFWKLILVQTWRYYFYMMLIIIIIMIPWEWFNFEKKRKKKSSVQRDWKLTENRKRERDNIKVLKKKKKVLIKVSILIFWQLLSLKYIIIIIFQYHLSNIIWRYFHLSGKHNMEKLKIVIIFSHVFVSDSIFDSLYHFHLIIMKVS